MKNDHNYHILAQSQNLFYMHQIPLYHLFIVANMNIIGEGSLNYDKKTQKLEKNISIITLQSQNMFDMYSHLLHRFTVHNMKIIHQPIYVL